MGQHPQKYLHNVASSIMGQVHVVYGGAPSMDSYETDDADFPQQLWASYGLKVVGVLSKMGPSALGRIAACGVGPHSSSGNLCHWDVNEGRNLNEAYDGKGLLTFLAAYVVVAAMVDILRADVQKMRDDEWKAEEEFYRGMADYVHHGHRSSSVPTSHSSR